jgi:hypothetical protein
MHKIVIFCKHFFSQFEVSTVCKKKINWKQMSSQLKYATCMYGPFLWIMFKNRWCFELVANKIGVESGQCWCVASGGLGDAFWQGEWGCGIQWKEGMENGSFFSFFLNTSAKMQHKEHIFTIFPFFYWLCCNSMMQPRHKQNKRWTSHMLQKR